MNSDFTRKFRVWGLLALPLAAVVVLALMLAWGQGSSHEAQAVGGANSPDLAANGPAGCGDTSATGSGKCSVSAGGGSFTIQVRLDNLGANFAMGMTFFMTAMATAFLLHFR